MSVMQQGVQGGPLRMRRGLGLMLSPACSPGRGQVLLARNEIGIGMKALGFNVYYFP